jgi:hypothetical protein
MKRFVPIDQETRAAVDTNCCAFHLNRRPQTLRMWAINDGRGPIKPLRINGRLAWPVVDIKRALGLAT